MAQEKCPLDSPEKCAENHGWKDVVKWEAKDLHRWEYRMRLSKPHHHQEESDSADCKRVRDATLGVLNQALNRVNDRRKDIPGFPVHFMWGENTLKGGPDSDAKHLRRASKSQPNQPYYDVIIFDKSLLEEHSGKRIVELLQHEVGHYLGIEHVHDFSNYDAEKCWVRDVDRENEPRGSGGWIDIIIITILYGECTYELDWHCWKEDVFDDDGKKSEVIKCTKPKLRRTCEILN